MRRHHQQVWDLRAGVIDPLVDLVLPRCCIGCGHAGMALCVGCAPDEQPHRLESGGMHVVAAGVYADGLRTALLAYKERGRRDLARPLGARLGMAVAQVVADCSVSMTCRFALPDEGSNTRPEVLLVWPPSARSVVAARGGDHLRRLAQRAAVLAGVRVAPGVLVPTRHVQDSAGLGIAERAENLRGSMRALPPPNRPGRYGAAGHAAGRPCAVVVDDIVTTGATIREAHRALAAAGWHVPAAAVVAATPRRVHVQPLAVPR